MPHCVLAGPPWNAARWVSAALAAVDLDEHALDEARIDLGVLDGAEDALEVSEPAVDEARDDRAAGLQLCGVEAEAYGAMRVLADIGGKLARDERRP